MLGLKDFINKKIKLKKSILNKGKNKKIIIRIKVGLKVKRSKGGFYIRVRVKRVGNKVRLRKREGK